MDFKKILQTTKRPASDISKREDSSSVIPVPYSVFAELDADMRSAIYPEYFPGPGMPDAAPEDPGTRSRNIGKWSRCT